MLRVHRWLPAEPVGVPRPGHVDVWIIALDVVHGGEPGAADLAPDEAERARRLRFEADRRSFVGTRVALRGILAGCLGVAPREIAFRAAPYGKPRLDPERHGSALRFNVSHSGDLALVAVSSEAEVGVDIELRRPRPDLEALVARYFSPCERVAIAALPPARRLEAFFDYWTLKEAYLKACGDGLNRRLDAFDVLLDPDLPPRLVDVRDRPGDQHRWTLAQFRPAADYAAAIAAERSVRVHTATTAR
jgi:4'-phosphopantetheinyl transferase